MYDIIYITNKRNVIMKRNINDYFIRVPCDKNRKPEIAVSDLDAIVLKGMLDMCQFGKTSQLANTTVSVIKDPVLRAYLTRCFNILNRIDRKTQPYAMQNINDLGAFSVGSVGMPLFKDIFDKNLCVNWELLLTDITEKDFILADSELIGELIKASNCVRSKYDSKEI